MSFAVLRTRPTLLGLEGLAPAQAQGPAGAAWRLLPGPRTRRQRRRLCLDGPGLDPVEEGARGVDGDELKPRLREDLLPLRRGALLGLPERGEHLDVDAVHDWGHADDMVVRQGALAHHQRRLLVPHGCAHVLEDLEGVLPGPVVEDVAHEVRVPVALGRGNGLGLEEGAPDEADTAASDAAEGTTRAVRLLRELNHLRGGGRLGGRRGARGGGRGGERAVGATSLK
mmetsp:Transcript_14777/g.34815  ORF Transcript_14777/g.34815 Transcript_14777/m.34815 type:complete len:227 (-) Transcript_14777:1039-1719(-)